MPLQARFEGLEGKPKKGVVSSNTLFICPKTAIFRPYIYVPVVVSREGDKGKTQLAHRHEGETLAKH